MFAQFEFASFGTCQAVGFPPEDLPLSYSFAAARPGVADKDATSLGQRSIVPSTVWQIPPAGSYVILCSHPRAP